MYCCLIGINVYVPGEGKVQVLLARQCVVEVVSCVLYVCVCVLHFLQNKASLHS